MRSALLGELGRVRAAFLGVAAFSGVINLLALAGSLYMLQVYDRVLPSKSVPTLIGLTVLIVVLYAAFGLLDYIRLAVLGRIAADLDRRVRGRVLGAMMRPAAISAPPTSPLADLDHVTRFLSGLGPTALFDLPWMPIYLGLVFLLHPWLGIFATAGAALLVALTLVAELLTRKPLTRAATAGARRAAFAEGARRNGEVARALGLEARLARRWDALAEAFLVDQLGASRVAASIGAATKVLRLMLQSGVLGLGAYLAIVGEVSAGAIIAASVVMSRALAPVELAVAHWRGFVAARDGMTRLEAALGPSDQRPRTTLPAPSASLAVERLAVVPPGGAQPTLFDVSFKLTAGDGLAVLGPSASGKSTLTRALVGAWPSSKGGSAGEAVRLDGAAIAQWEPEVLGRYIGYLPQDVQLFAGSIADNISRFHDGAQSEAIVAAAREAGIHEMILRLPQGYDTEIGEGGRLLSAGQRQLVGLARALYGSPFLVVLDEPNANLDATGEASLTQAIAAVRRRGGIVVVAAHRPSALAGANLVLALANGRMKDFGPREEVLRRILAARPARVEAADGVVTDWPSVGAAGGGA